ncbi:hypothetical protein SDC9_87568 [bioreactor metagenome]|uniref:Uncharacterized protein n=1 Tax=bioreactor metagenome TaxID=1076179 RepID=A0A644ZJA4_9ZZZZ
MVYMVGRHLGQVGCILCYPVGIEPGVKFHTPFMCLFYCKLQGIIHRVGCYVLISGKVNGPRFVFGDIKCICSGPDLENHGIKVHSLEKIQVVDQLLLLLFGGKSRRRWPVDIVDSGYPYSPPLMFSIVSVIGRFGRGTCRYNQQRGYEQCK